MSLSFQNIENIPEDDWDGLVRRSPDGWVFGLHGWQRLVTAVEEWGFSERGFGIFESERLVAVVPLHVQLSNRLAASTSWGGAGPILRRGLSSEDRERILNAATTEMIEIAKDVDATRLEVSSSPVTETAINNNWGVNPFALLGFDDQSLISKVVFLGQEEELLWAGLSKTARNLIRRSINAGFRVKKVDWPTSLDAYYDVHIETYRRTGVAPHPRSYFSGIADRLGGIGASTLFALLTPGGEPIAFQNVAKLGIGAYYHTGCSRTALQAISPGYHLMWEAIKAAKADGAVWFDIGWIFPASKDPKQKGLTHFKTRFGGEAHPAFRAKLDLAAEHPIATPRSAAAEPHQSNAPSFGVAGRLARRARRLLASRAAP